VSLKAALAGIAPQQCTTLFEQANAWIIAEASRLYMLTRTVQPEQGSARLGQPRRAYQKEIGAVEGSR
jgi:hypothetical protein